MLLIPSQSLLRNDSSPKGGAIGISVNSARKTQNAEPCDLGQQLLNLDDKARHLLFVAETDPACQGLSLRESWQRRQALTERVTRDKIKSNL